MYNKLQNTIKIKQTIDFNKICLNVSGRLNIILDVSIYERYSTWVCLYLYMHD